MSGFSELMKSNLKVFTAIPNLATDDRYNDYLPSILTHLKRQETTVNMMTPYITPPYDGTFSPGMPDRLYAYVDRMNHIIEKFVSTDATNVFFNDGDVEIPPNTIETLIKHNVDVVSGVYPWHNFDESRAMMFGRTDKDNPCGNLRPRDWDYLKGRVVGSKDEPWAGGTGCLLVSRRVFEQHQPLRFNKDNDCGMDVLFWKRCQDAGFSARVDARIVCGHLPRFRLSEIDEWLT